MFLPRPPLKAQAALGGKNNTQIPVFKKQDVKN
jgi:hypothetical protein